MRTWAWHQLCQTAVTLFPRFNSSGRIGAHHSLWSQHPTSAVSNHILLPTTWRRQVKIHHSHFKWGVQGSRLSDLPSRWHSADCSLWQMHYWAKVAFGIISFKLTTWEMWFPFNNWEKEALERLTCLNSNLLSSRGKTRDQWITHWNMLWLMYSCDLRCSGWGIDITRSGAHTENFTSATVE